MSVNNPTDQEPDESISQQMEPVTVPITVPTTAETHARKHLRVAREHGNDRVELEDYLTDAVPVSPEFLTSDRAPEENGEELTHAVYSCLSESEHRQVEATVEASPAFESVNEYVRDAVLRALSTDY